MDTNDLKLTDAHNALIDNFISFLSNDERYFYIDAIGGAGKTTICKYLIDVVIPEYNETAEVIGIPTRGDVFMTAMHNKAAAVLRESGLEANTIQSHLGMVLTFKNGNYTLVPKRTIKGSEEQVVFIDECSTMDSVIFNRLLTLPKAKIIFVGDRFQAPPVGVDESLIYKRQCTLNCLKEIMRTDIPDLKNVYEELREQVEYNEPSKIPLINGVVETIDRLDGFDLAAELTEKGHTVVNLGYTNSSVETYNRDMRSTLNRPKDITKGDTMIVNSAVADGYGHIIPTDTRIEITRVSEDPNISNDLGLDVVRVIGTTISGSSHTFLAAKDNLTRLARIKDMQRSKNWPEYFNLKERIADLRHSHSLTVHKSQGSTYDYVFIDLDDISKCTNNRLARKLVYVAVTRARKKVYLIGNLKERIGGMQSVQSTIES